MWLLVFANSCQNVNNFSIYNISFNKYIKYQYH
jgi:hypothetical protein